MGSWGGDWDTLEAALPFTNRGDLERLLAACGHREPLPPGDGPISLAVHPDDGRELRLTVTFTAAEAGHITLLAAVYVTADDLARARRLESWLDRQGIRVPDQRS